MSAGSNRFRLVSDPNVALPDPNALARLITSGNDDLQEIVEIIRSVCQMDWAAITVIETDSCHQAVTSGLAPFRARVGEDMCHFVKDAHFIFAIEDASQDERFKSSPWVTGETMRLGGFATAPIYDLENEMVGRLCVFHPEPAALSESQLRVLGTLARNISGIVAMHQRQHQGAGLDGPLQLSGEVLEVAAQISHDMRLPLASISMTLEMLDDLLTAEHLSAEHQLVSSALRSTRRLSNMVEGILEIHQVGEEVSLEPVDLHALSREVITELGQVLQSARASMKIQSLPTVYGDENLLYRILLNLLSNSIKFAREESPPQIEIGAQHRRQAWEITVTDNGLGIPVDQRTAVFETFARLHPDRPGNGIGLPVVAQMVKAHGGEVGVRDSPMGVGAEFWFTIPDRQPK